MDISRKIGVLKWLIYGYAVILGITGLGQLILGTLILWDHIIFHWLAENNFWKPSALLLCSGLFSLLLCWIGFSSTIKENRKMLILFTVLIIVSVTMHIVICVWSLRLRWDLMPRSSNLENSVDHSFGRFFTDNSIFDSSHIWNKVQAQYKCCGVDGHIDYRRGAVPWSCFSRSDTNEDLTNLHQRGCLQVMETRIKKLLSCCTILSLISAVLQSVGLFCTIQLITIVDEKVDENAEIDLSSMSFRQKRAHIEMLQPLSLMKDSKRPKYHHSDSTKSENGNS